jgi:peroxiredoxin
MKKLFTLLFSALVMQAAMGQVTIDSANLLKPGSRLPSFTLTTIDGNKISPSDLEGKVVLINFFATWCGPCMQEMPELYRDIWQKYRNNKDFMLLVIDREEKPAVVKAWADKKQFDIPFCLDEKRETYSMFATKFIPRNYLFDRKGILVYHSMGFEKEEFGRLKNQLEELLR